MSFGTHSAASCPRFGGEGETLARFEKEVELWNHKATLDVTKRGPALALKMAARAQEICKASGAPELIFGGRRQRNHEGT